MIHPEWPAGVGVPDRREELLPPPLLPVFSDSFARSCVLYDEFTYRQALRVFRETGLEAATIEPGSTAEIVDRADLDRERAPIPLDWILRQLASRGALERTGPPGEPARYRLVSPLPRPDPAEPMEAQRMEDPSWLISYEMARTAADDYPAFLRGRISGEQILFSAPRLALWFDYFSNENGLYAVNNVVGAFAAAEWMPAEPGARILELGGGLGSAAVSLLDRLEKAGRLGSLSVYRFTEIIPAFLRRGQKTLSDRFGPASFFSFGRLDMNRPFGEQGIDEGSLSMVYAVNTLHVARDLSFTLGQILRSLAPGGLLLLSECVRPFPDQAVYVEFVFNLMEAFRAPVLDAVYRPNGGFLTPEQWSAALPSAGFSGVRFMPDIVKIRERYPAFYTAAVGATRPA